MNRVILLLLILTSLSGCVSVPRSRNVYYPVTSGFHTTLPSRNARVIVLSSDQSALNAATTWLVSRGLVVVDHTRHRHASDDGALAVLMAAKSAGAEIVVSIDVVRSSERVSSARAVLTLPSVDVTVRAVSVHTGQTAWKGNAHSAPSGRLVAADASTLTCQALATAWGFRPGGQLEIPSELMCTVGQTEPVLSP